MEIKVVPYLLFCSLTSVIYCLPFFLWSTTQIIIWYQPNVCRCWEYEYTHKHWRQIESGGTIVYPQKLVTPLPHPSKVRIQCASARSISTRYNQPYAWKQKPSILRPRIARQYNNRLIDWQRLASLLIIPKTWPHLLWGLKMWAAMPPPHDTGVYILT